MIIATIIIGMYELLCKIFKVKPKYTLHDLYEYYFFEREFF